MLKVEDKESMGVKEITLLIIKSKAKQNQVLCTGRVKKGALRDLEN